MIGGGDGTVTLFDNFGKSHAQTPLRGSVVAMSFSPDKNEVGKKRTGICLAQFAWFRSRNACDHREYLVGRDVQYTFL